jgi:internalin A
MNRTLLVIMPAMPPPPADARCYCRKCGYDLRASEKRCPECGGEFDPTLPKTFDRSPRSHVIRWWTRRLVIVLVALAILPAAGLLWLWWPWHREQVVIESLRQVCDAWRFSRQTMDTRPWLSRYLPEQLRYLNERAIALNLRFEKRPGNDSDLAQIASLDSLVAIELHNLRTTNQGIANLKTLDRLQWLFFYDSQFDDAALKQLGAMAHLERLSLVDASVTNDSVPYLSGLSKLKFLELGGSKFTDECLQYLSQPGLTTLTLSHTSITGERSQATEQIQLRLPLLRALRFDGGQIADAGIQRFTLPLLEALSLLNTNVSGEQIDPELLHRQMPNLKRLAFQDSPVTDAGVARIAAVPGLTELELTGARITDDGVRQVAAMRQVEILGLKKTAVSDVSLPYLFGMDRLIILYLNDTAVTDAGVETLLKGLERLPALGSVSLSPKSDRPELTWEAYAKLQSALDSRQQTKGRNPIRSGP